MYVGFALHLRPDHECEQQERPDLDSPAVLALPPPMNISTSVTRTVSG